MSFKKYLPLFACLFILSPTFLHADRSFEPKISSYLVKKLSESQLIQISDGFEIVHRDEKGYEIYVKEPLKDLFLEIAPEAQLLSENIKDDLFTTLSPAELKSNYHSLEDVYSLLKRFAQEYPKLTQLIHYGDSKQGRPLYALKVSDNAKKDEDEKEVLITSATHGDEIITVEVLLASLTTLLEEGKDIPRLQSFLENYEIFFIPVVNPDGFSRQSRYSNGVDPNRAYPMVDGGQRSSIQCTEHLIEFFHSKNFLGSLDIHASGRMIIYPWAYTRKAPADSEAFAKAARSMSAHNRYRTGQISRILYPAPGSSADYYYSKSRSLSMAVEIGRRKAPRPSRIPQVIENTREMIWRFIEEI